jgi:SIR2-like domain
MVERSFAELARDLKQRREVADPPPVLLLGAGASVESGIGAMSELFDFVGCADFEEFTAYIKDLTVAERYRLLSRFLQTQRPAEVTPGYHALATLCADAYFDVVLTTNLDPLLDDALAAARLWRKDYLVLVNGVIRMDWLGILATAPSPRVKVIKLHGDLFQRCMAWTVEEMDEMVSSVHEEILAALNSRDLLVVGHSLRDQRIRELVLACKGSVWFTHPKEVPGFLRRRKQVRSVVGPDCTFERLFTGLAAALTDSASVAAPTRAARRGVFEPAPSLEGQTLDDLVASVVGLAASRDASPSLTGFVLAEPRVIVTDGYVENIGHFDPAEVTLVAAGDRRLRTRFLRRDDSYAFGPQLLEVPDDLKLTGLHLDDGPVTRDLEVRVAVCAGERTGVSSGVIANPRRQRLEIQPIGMVDKLVEVQCTVAPGASGAPVVDRNMAVRGFVVAGGPDRPPAFMYPAECWAPYLES